MYLHLYYNSEKALEHENRFNAMLDQLESELTTGNRKPENERQYAKYFDITETPVRGIKITPKQDAIKKAEKDYGFFAMSNEIKDPIKALDIYRNKDLVEKAFGNLKERLNLRRTGASTESSLDGKLFVQFVALIYMSYLKKKMSNEGLFDDYTMQKVLDELDVIEVFENPGSAIHVGEVTKKQEGLYKSLGVTPPNTL
jgi:transposase